MNLTKYIDYIDYIDYINYIDYIDYINYINTFKNYKNFFYLINTLFFILLFLKLGKFNKKKEEEIKIVLDSYLNKGEAELKNFSNKLLSKDEIDNLKNKFIDEVTPSGLVKLFYDSYLEAFCYYSDQDIPYKYLEVVSRLYVLKYNCVNLYINYKEELFKARDIKLNKNKPSDNNTNLLYAVSKNKKLPENSNIYIVPEKSNKYIKKGTIKNLDEKEKKKVREEKKEKVIKEINFKDFKKL